MAEAIVNSCAEVKNKETCYIKQFNTFSQKNSLNQSLQVLKEVQKNDSAANFCHIIAHKISNNEVSKNPQKWMAILGQVPPLECNMGFFHGVIEGHMQTNPAFIINDFNMLTTCKEVQNSVKSSLQKQYLNDCIHTMAHILLVQFEAKVEPALAVCKKLEGELRRECSYGVFMEDAQRQNLVLHGYKTHGELGFNDRVFYINECNNYEDIEQITCWVSKGWIFYRIEKANPQKIFEDCIQAELSEGFLGCYEKGLGISIAIDKTQNINLIPIKDYCIQLESDQLYEKCNLNLISFLLSISNVFNEFSYTYCSFTKDNFQNACINYIDKIIKTNQDRVQQSSLIEEYPKILFE